MSVVAGYDAPVPVLPQVDEAPCLLRVADLERWNPGPARQSCVHHRVHLCGRYFLLVLPRAADLQCRVCVLICCPGAASDEVIAVLQAWRFFKLRITYEDRLLQSFFGDEYLQYRRRTPSGLPLID